MTYLELIQITAVSADIPVEEATDLTDGIFDTIASTLESGSDVDIPGLGTFVVNIAEDSSGASDKTTQKKVVSFMPSQNLIHTLNLPEPCNE